MPQHPSLPNGVPRTATANTLKKQQIACQLVQGFTVTELADYHNYTYEGMRKLCATEEMRALVTEQQGELLDAGRQAMFTFLLNARQLAQAQLTAALDTSDPDNFKARTWILNQIMPQRQTTTHGGDVQVNLQVNTQVLGELTSTIKEVGMALGSAHTGAPTLIPGKQALPPLDASASTAEDQN